jgi:PAS domain S-box-containing protein
MGFVKDLAQSLLSEIYFSCYTYCQIIPCIREPMAEVTSDIPSQKRTENKLHESDAKFQFLAEFTVSAIFIYKGMRFIYVNPATEHLTGYSRQELLEMNFNDLFPDKEKKGMRKWGMQVQRTETTSSHGVFKIITKSGEERWIDLTTAMIDFEKKKAAIGTAFDITEHKRAEVLQDAVYRIAQAADRSKGVGDLFSAVHAIIAEVMNAKNFYIALYDNNRNMLSFPYFVDEVDIPSPPSNPGKGLTEYVLRTGKSLLVDLALHNELCEQGEIELVGVPSPIWLGVPLIVDNEVIGAMVVQHYSDPKAYGDREKRILEFVSSQVAMVINRKRSEDTVRESEERYHRRADELAALYETARDLATQRDLKTMLNTVADRVTTLLRSPGCSIYLFDKERKDLEAIISRGLPGMIGVRLQLGEGIAGKVAQTLQPMIIDDHRIWANRSPKFSDIPTTAVAEVPMVFGGDLIGVLTVYEIESEDNFHIRKYTQADVDLLTVFAGTAAVAVHNTRLFDETRQRLLELEVLYQTSLAATQIINVRAVAQRIVETLEHLMNWQSCSIWLIDSVDQKPTLLVNSRMGLTEKALQAEANQLSALITDKNQGIVGSVCSLGETVRTGDVRTVPNYIDVNIGTVSELCVPLKIVGKIIGCINIESCESNAFSEHDERILSTLAAQAASAIDNANLFQEALRAAERRSILHQASQEIARASQDPELLYAAVHRAAVQLMPADVFVITLFDEDKQEIHGVYLIARGERHPKNVFHIGKGISSKVIKSGKSILIQDFKKTTHGITPYIFSKSGMTRSVLAVPMRAGERIIGMISTQSYQPNIYTRDDDVLLEMLAAHAGAAIENARLFDETRKRVTELELLYQVSLAAAEIHSLQAVAQRIVDALEKFFKWDGSIWLVKNHKPVLLAHCTMGLTGESLKQELGRIDSLITSLDDGIIGSVCKSGKAVCSGDVRKKSHYLVANENVNSELCVPLKVGGKTIGCINVESEIHNAFSEHDERLLTTLANQAAVAIENARLFEETRRHAIRQAALNEIITVSARAGTDPSDILNTTLEQTLKALGLDMGVIWLSWSTQGVQRMASKNIPLALNNVMTNAALAAGYSQMRTLVVDDWRNIKRRNSELFVSMGIFSTIIVPLLSKENRIGGMAIASQDAHHWTDEEIALVEAIGREVGSAAERAKLFEETTTRLDELEAVNKVSKSLRRAQSLQEMLPQLIDETLKILGVDAGGIWLYNSERGKLCQMIGRGWCTQMSQLELDRDESLPGKVYTTGDIYFSHDVAQDSLTSPAMRELVPQEWSAICLPIQSEQEPIGVLFASTPLPHEFTYENAHLLVTLTEIAGNAIHRTRLNEQLIKHAAELEARVTERTAELQSALQKSLAADRLKSEFIINVNHELRTPLTNLVLYYQMLRTQPTVKSEERLDVIGRELQRLRSLIEELLNLSRFDLGQVTLRPVQCDLNVLIQTLINDRRSLAEERGLLLNSNLQSDLSQVWLDEPTITQAVSNLLTNAMNYTPRGGEILVATITGLRDGEPLVGIRVQDTGRGIDSDDLPHLFERFYRGKAGRDSGAPGTGLGLAIVKQVVEHHHGRIDVENGAGEKGAVFTVWLPVKQPQKIPLNGVPK